MTRALGSLASRTWGLWMVKRVFSPLDRIVVRLSKGRVPPPSSLMVPSLLLSVNGRRSGLRRSIPLVYVRDGPGLLVGNARPASERKNPWVLNLRAVEFAEVSLGRQTFQVTATELEGEALYRAWSFLSQAWPPFVDHYRATGERSVFLLEPMNSDPGLVGSGDSPGRPLAGKRARQMSEGPGKA